MSPRSPPNPLTDTVPFFFRGLREVEFRALRNGEADSGSSPLLSLLESSGVAARAGTSPPTEVCGPLAGPMAGCIGEVSHGSSHAGRSELLT